MDYSIDLTRNQKKNYILITCGVLFFLLGSINLIVSIGAEQYDKTSYIPFVIVSILLGIIFIVKGFGKTIRQHLGKAFIIINEDIISIKPNIIKKEIKIEWEKISDIKYVLPKFIFKMNDNSEIKINLGNFDLDILRSIKRSIVLTAREKGIPVTLN